MKMEQKQWSHQIQPVIMRNDGINSFAENKNFFNETAMSRHFAMMKTIGGLSATIMTYFVWCPVTRIV